MNYKVYISDQADQDLRGVFEYIAFKLCAPENAEGLLERLEKAIDGLSHFPERNVLYRVEPWRSRGLRVVTVDHYCVFYIFNEVDGNVSVLRVIYSERNIEKILDEMA